MLEECNYIRLLGNMTACMKEVVKESTKFVSAYFGKPDTEEISIGRQTLWAARVGKSGKAMPSLTSLPQTTEAFYENVERIHIQACICKQAFDADPQDLNPCDYSWRNDDASNILSPVSIKCSLSYTQLALTDKMWVYKR
ncbi:hypothetical protein DPMN_088813 [Dreissena polymorpha]|uniref:Uncharacterized protein n=1 Tax=Dreissena polymorpha TaxID=45954 RepID=A0A9D4QWR2_DREPO|nr:hypothetical protein DPMN_088813 [Dreissena polymorpha]